MSTAFEILGIEKEIFDKIISRHGAFIKICKCLFMCLSSDNEELKQVAADLLQYIAEAKRDEIRMDYDTEPDSWITLENGEHVPLDSGGNAIGGAGGWATGKNFGNARKATPKVEKKSGLSDEMSPRRTDYDFDLDDGEEDFIRKNFGNRRNPGKLYDFYHEVENNGGDGAEAVQDEYYKMRLSKCTEGLHELTRDEADEILYDNLRRSTIDAWFREYNHEVKPALMWQMTQSPEVHNAALNVMYTNYKYSCEEDGVEPLSFEDFLVTPIKMYRGGTGKEYKEASPFSSYTFSKKVAESFTGSEVGQGHEYDPNGVVYEAEIRPIDTYGSVFTNGESEILVPRMIAPNGNRDEADVHDDGVFFAGELNDVKDEEYNVEYAG